MIFVSEMKSIFNIGYRATRRMKNGSVLFEKGIGTGMG